jgi:hypothetical protein
MIDFPIKTKFPRPGWFRQSYKIHRIQRYKIKEYMQMYVHKYLLYIHFYTHIYSNFQESKQQMLLWMTM